jgi:hypothetical protein
MTEDLMVATNDGKKKVMMQINFEQIDLHFNHDRR